MKKILLIAVIVFVFSLTSCVNGVVEEEGLWMNNMLKTALQNVQAEFNDDELSFFYAVGLVDYQAASERATEIPLTTDDVQDWEFYFAYGDRNSSNIDILQINYENGSWEEPFISEEVAPLELVFFNMPLEVSIDLDKAIERAWNMDEDELLKETEFIQLYLPLEDFVGFEIREPIYQFKRIDSETDFILIGAFTGTQYTLNIEE